MKVSKRATLKFFGELNDFFPHSSQEGCLDYSFNDNPSMKHVVESLGVPHTEVFHVLRNDQSADLRFLLQDRDQVELYPFSFAQRGLPGAPSTWEGSQFQFLLDNHLGKLAKSLRMLGLDAQYRNDFQDEELVEIAQAGGITLLTRDRRLLMRKAIQTGYWIRAKEPDRQLKEVLIRYNLFSAIDPFRRCMRCNGLLQPVNKAEIFHKLLPLTKLYYDEFHLCPDCGQIYWKGSHVQRMLHTIESLR
jgi:uncharacterized protein with PIN domain